MTHYVRVSNKSKSAHAGKVGIRKGYEEWRSSYYGYIVEFADGATAFIAKSMLTKASEAEYKTAKEEAPVVPGLKGDYFLSVIKEGITITIPDLSLAEAEKTGKQEMMSGADTVVVYKAVATFTKPRTVVDMVKV